MQNLLTCKKLLGVAALLVLQASDAQQLPVPGSAKRGSFTLEDKWSPQERDLFWRKTTVDGEGFLRIAGTTDQVNMINEAQSHGFFRPKIETGLESVVSRIVQAGFPFVGTWKEDEYRTTMLFGNDSTGLLMYTIFNYEKMGASISVMKDFARFQIKGSPAVLTLMVLPAGNNGLWKLSSWRAGVAHEIYLNEELSSRERKPKRNLAQILRIGNAIIN